MDMNCSQQSVSKFFSFISEDVLTLICTFLNHHAQRNLGYTCVSYIHMCPITFQCFENLLKQQKLTPVNLLSRLHKVCLNIGDCLYQYNRITNAIQNSIDASNTNNAPNTNNHAQFHRLEVYIMENPTGRRKSNWKTSITIYSLHNKTWQDTKFIFSSQTKGTY